MKTLKKHQSLLEFCVVIILPVIALFTAILYFSLTIGTTASIGF